MYVGTYVGPPTVWSWQEVPLYGCAGINAVIDIGTVHFVVGQDDIYVFDGARPISVGDKKLRKWFNDNVSGTYRYKTKVRYDKGTDTVWVFFPNSASSTGACDMCLVYHMKTGQWGRSDRTVEQVFIYTAPGETFDGSSGTTFDNDTGVFDQLSPGSPVLAAFDSSHILSSIDGDPVSGYFTLHDIGNDSVVTHLSTVTLQYAETPTTASVDPYTFMAQGLPVVGGINVIAYDLPGAGKNKFQLRKTANWHRLFFLFTGRVKVVAYDVPLKTAGTR
jgi:hypothetical protein